MEAAFAAIPPLYNSGAAAEANGIE